jgi:hypothetical protein
MRAKDLEGIEIDALALQQLAERVLARVRAVKGVNPIKVNKKISGAAELEARILSGRMKPDKAKKKK